MEGSCGGKEQADIEVWREKGVFPSLWSWVESCGIDLEYITASNWYSQHFLSMQSNYKDNFLLENTGSLGWNWMNVGLEGTGEETKPHDSIAESLGQKLVVTELARKFSIFHGTRIFIAMLTRTYQPTLCNNS
jgi:hypothetical protein